MAEENNLLENVYLPTITKQELEGSKAFEVVKKNNGDVNSLITDEKSKEVAPPDEFNFSTFDEVENFKAKHLTKENMKMFADGVGEFTYDLGSDALRSLVVAGVNGIDFGTQFLPVIDKLVQYSPMNAGTGFQDLTDDKQVMDYAMNISNNLGEFREFVKNFDPSEKDNKKKDGNFVTEMLGIIAQDMAYSIPIYKKLKSLGINNTAALVIGGGLGGAIGIEDEIFGGTSTFLQHYRESDIKKIKDFLGVLPNTTYDQIADEVVQTFEYGAFSYAIPQLIKAFQFMKTYVPAYATYAATTLDGKTDAVADTEKKTLKIQTDEEGKPLVQEMNILKPLVTAAQKLPIFKSAVVSAVEKIPNKGSGNQILGQIKNIPGVKETELKWIGLDDYLKDKKSVTKQEISEFVQNNRIDVNEVKFGGGSEVLLQDLTNKRLKFEEKWFENQKKILDTKDFPKYPKFDKEAYINRNINYDGIEVFNTADNTYTMVPFGQFDSYFGADVSEGRIIADKIFKGPENQKFTISDIELEKFKIEDEVRKWRAKGSKPKFEQYTEPGGKDYTELVFSAKTAIKPSGKYRMPFQTLDANAVGVPQKGEIGYKPNMALMQWKSPHFGVENEIAHVRFKTRDLNGKKVLTVEEMQSDLLISAKRDPKVADFPFKQNWHELVIKRLIRYGADNGFDAVAIPKGSVAAKRYGQDIAHIKNLKMIVEKYPKGKTFMDIDGKTTLNNLKDTFIFKITGLDEKLNSRILHQKQNNEVYDILKQYKVSDKIKNTVDDILAGKKQIEPMSNTFEFSTIPVPGKVVGSGKGKHELYDKAIPSFMKKYGKKWNARVYDDVWDGSKEAVSRTPGAEDLHSPGFDRKIPLTIIEITPAMKKAVQEGGQSLFEILGFATGAGVGAKAVSDNIQNNTISN